MASDFRHAGRILSVLREGIYILPTYNLQPKNHSGISFYCISHLTRNIGGLQSPNPRPRPASDPHPNIVALQALQPSARSPRHGTDPLDTPSFYLPRILVAHTGPIACFQPRPQCTLSAHFKHRVSVCSSRNDLASYTSSRCQCVSPLATPVHADTSTLVELLPTKDSHDITF